MPPEVQLATWNGKPTKQGDTFRLTKGPRQAVCELWTDGLGWELRLLAVGELLQSQVCRSEDEVLETSDAWKAALISKGWGRELP